MKTFFLFSFFTQVCAFLINFVLFVLRSKDNMIKRKKLLQDEVVKILFDPQILYNIGDIAYKKMILYRHKRIFHKAQQYYYS